MKRTFKKVFSLCMLLSATAIMSVEHVAPYIQFRSEGRDTARKLVGTTSHHVYLDDMESFYGTFNMTLQYDRSFRGKELTQALFGCSLYPSPIVNNPADACDSSCNNNKSLVISGFSTADRNPKDWMAENFLLPSDFKSVITFSPLVQNILVDFNLYVGLDEWVKGLYFRLYGPVVNNRMSLDPDETVINPGTEENGSYPQGYYSPQEGVAPDQMFSRALQFFSGQPLPAQIPNVTFIPLANAKMHTCGHQSTTGFAELRGEFGWNYLHEDYHVGLNIQAAAPTGKRPHGEWIFETEVGNGKHWELGAGFGAHWTMWRSEDEEKHFDFVVEADITHLFNAKQKRTFDLIGKPNSRYMLAQKLVTNVGGENILSGDSNAGLQFGNTYQPVANFTTIPIKVSVGVQADVVGMFNYTSRGFSWDFGYNFWATSKEHISLSDCDAAFPTDTWALKGDASIAGHTNTDPDITVLLAATESGANIHTGTNSVKDPNAIYNNPGVDTAIAATTGEDNIPVLAFVNDNPIDTSKKPVFIQLTDLDLKGAEIKARSNKVFTHFSYTWIDREDWIPYLGIGASAQFGSHNNHSENCDTSTATTDCNDHTTSIALSNWALWVKGGVSFD